MSKPTQEHWDTALQYRSYGQRMARDFAQRFHHLRLEVEDLTQVALLALANAAKDFREDRTASFLTFATRRVWAALVLEGKRQAPHYAWDRQQDTMILSPVSETDTMDGEATPTSTPSAEDMALLGLEAGDLATLVAGVWSLVDRLPAREADFIRRAFDPDNPESLAVIGATCQPPLSKQRVK